jgi:hypothetical protein
MGAPRVVPATDRRACVVPPRQWAAIGVPAALAARRDPSAFGRVNG